MSRIGSTIMHTPATGWAPRPRVDNAMVKALARAFRWRKMLEEGTHATIEELARSKGIAKTYFSQVLRLTLLSPGIVEAILDGRQHAELQLDDLLAGFPLEWGGQQSRPNALRTQICAVRTDDWKAAAERSPRSDGMSVGRVQSQRGWWLR